MTVVIPPPWRRRAAGCRGGGRPRSVSGVIRAVFAARTWQETAYLLIDLAVGIAGFTFVVTGLSLGAGLLITLVGLPVLVVTLLGCRGGAWLERRRARLLSLELPDPPPLNREGSFLRRASRPLVDGAAWRAAAYFVVMLPVGVATFTVTVTIWSTALGLLTLPAWAWALPHGGPQFGEAYYWSRPWQLAVAAVAGALLTLLAPWVVRVLAACSKALVSGLLGSSRRELEERAEILTETRSRTVDASIDERRRLERDLHDGAQQRLVALGMDLGIALEKLDTDPDAAKALLRDAHGDAQLALRELRDLARGIHPAVLSDRGLDAAVSGLAARSPVPVRVHGSLARRPPASVEATAYFIASEALANVAKHANASSAEVLLAIEDDRLRVEIADDGRGGADPDGAGLRGLADRAAALDGSFTVDSPHGGGTRIVTELPCAS
jgi:signal transduction histidine kinase